MVIADARVNLRTRPAQTGPLLKARTRTDESLAHLSDQRFRLQGHDRRTPTLRLCESTKEVLENRSYDAQDTREVTIYTSYQHVIFVANYTINNRSLSTSIPCLNSLWHNRFLDMSEPFQNQLSTNPNGLFYVILEVYLIIKKSRRYRARYKRYRVKTPFLLILNLYPFSLNK